MAYLALQTRLGSSQGEHSTVILQALEHKRVVEQESIFVDQLSSNVAICIKYYLPIMNLNTGRCQKLDA